MVACCGYLNLKLSWEISHFLCFVFNHFLVSNLLFKQKSWYGDKKLAKSMKDIFFLPCLKASELFS